MNERLKTHSKTQKKSADLVSNKLRIGVFQRYQMKCKSVSKKSPRYSYTSQIGQQIQQAISDYINSLMIGDSVLLSRIYSPANLGVVSGGNARYYDIQELTIGKSPGALSSSNIDIRYNESASCTPENIVITVES